MTPTEKGAPVTLGTIKVCPRDSEPVIFTMEFPGIEYVCVECGWQGDVFAPDGAPATAERQERYAVLLDRYEDERAGRTGRPKPKPPRQDVPRPICKGCGTTAEGPLDHSGKPAHWFTRTIDRKTEYACSRACITEGTVAPW